MKEKDWYTAAEAAEELNVKPSKLRRLIRLGLVKSDGRLGWNIIITREEVERVRGLELDRRKKGAVKSRWSGEK